MSDKLDKIVADIFTEIGAAQEIHGLLPDDTFYCLVIIMEELGEASESALLARIPDHTGRDKAIKNFRLELIQVAAMIISLLMKVDSDEINF